VFLRNNESDYNRHSGYVVIFRESLLAHAKELGMTVIESEHYEADSFDAQHFVSTVFAHPDRPTAIINQANASVLSQVLMALHDAGMSIPQDVSVLSCGTYFEGEPTRFPITEMPVMPEELCAEAVNLLTSAIEERADINGSVKLIEPALKRRGSVAEAGSGGTI
jgi:DNA-binding LacI/PurR family transcriptional regulator